MSVIQPSFQGGRDYIAHLKIVNCNNQTLICALFSATLDIDTNQGNHGYPQGDLLLRIIKTLLNRVFCGQIFEYEQEVSNWNIQTNILSRINIF